MEDSKTLYDDAKFELAENLRGEAKEAAIAKGISNGLVFVAVKYGSKAKWNIRKVDSTPTEFLRKIAKEEGVELEKAFGSLRD